MAITITTSKVFPEVQIFTPDAFEDIRGDIYTTWNSNEYPPLNWRLDKFSHSKKDVLRGIHGDDKTWKLINCIHGKFFLAVVDFRRNSKTRFYYDWFILSAENRKQVLVPPGFGNGHFVMSDDCVFHYKLAFDGNYNDVGDQFTLKWNDSMINIDWPHNNPILFGRDK